MIIWCYPHGIQGDPVLHQQALGSTGSNLSRLPIRVSNRSAPRERNMNPTILYRGSSLWNTCVCQVMDFDLTRSAKRSQVLASPITDVDYWMQKMQLNFTLLPTVAAEFGNCHPFTIVAFRHGSSGCNFSLSVSRSFPEPMVFDLPYAN